MDALDVSHLLEETAKMISAGAIPADAVILVLKSEGMVSVRKAGVDLAGAIGMAVIAGDSLRHQSKLVATNH